MDARALWNALFETTSTGYAVFQVDCEKLERPTAFNFSGCNPVFIRLTGTGSGLETYDDRALLERIQDQEPGGFFEHYFEKTQCWCRIQVNSPKPGYRAVMLTDITRAREKYQSSIEAIEAIDDLVVELDGTLVLRRTWAGGKVHLADSPVPLENRVLDEVLRDDALIGLWKKNINQALSSNSPNVFVYPAIYQGDTRWYRVRIAPHRAEHKTGWVLAAVRDITERKKDEEALRESERRLKIKLQNIFNQEGERSSLDLATILDTGLVQSLMDDFYALTGIGIAILDLRGQVLVATGWQDICTRFHRVHPVTRSHCLASDTVLSQGVEPGSFRLYRCKNNMWDIATPILVGGQLLGNLFLGQFFFDDEEPDQKDFRTQAQLYGFDQEEYLEALGRVPRFSRQTVDRVMRFYAGFAGLVSDLSYGNLRLARALVQRDELLLSLRESEEKYRLVVENAREALCVVLEGKIQFSNRMFSDMTGIEPPELIGRSVYEFFPQEEHDRLRARYESLLRGEMPDSPDEFRVELDPSRTGWVSINTVPIQWYDRPAVLAFISDITERKQAEEVLQETLGQLSALLGNMRQGVLFEDIDRRIRYSNRFFCELFGLPSPESMMGQDCAQAARKIKDIFQQPDQFVQTIENHLAERRPVIAEELALRDGRVFERDFIPVDIEGTAGGSYWIYRDVTNRKKNEERIRFLSFHDSLTGLYNRAFIEEELHRFSASRQLPLGVVLCDVNGLKLINDAFGHQAGDQLLVAFAQKLQENCRQEDLIARWGGDEFILLLPSTPEPSVDEIVERIRKSCRKSDHEPILLSVSLGWVVKNTMEESIDQLIALAEERMNRNKLSEGRSARSAIIASLEESLLETTRETEAHAQRLRIFSRKVGQKLGLPESDLNELDLLARLHDLGKIAVPRHILDKPGPLTAEEWEIVKKHPEIGYRIAQSSPDLASVAEAILSHHERWDGTGYPQGLKGEEISHLARIVAVVDAFDSMTHGRPYRDKRSIENALLELQRFSGSQFDPRIVEIFAEIVVADTR